MDITETDKHMLRPSRGKWFAVNVDRGWPPTWELSHCGSCDATWWTLELRPDGWFLWDLPSKAAYDYGRKCGYFLNVAEVERWITNHSSTWALCEHVE